MFCYHICVLMLHYCYLGSMSCLPPAGAEVGPRYSVNSKEAHTLGGHTRQAICMALCVRHIGDGFWKLQPYIPGTSWNMWSSLQEVSV